MYSILFKLAIDVNKAVELVNTITMLGFIIDIVDVEIAEHHAIKISAIIIFFI